MTPEQEEEKKGIMKRLREAPPGSPKFKKLMKRLALLKLAAGEMKLKAGSKLQ